MARGDKEENRKPCLHIMQYEINGKWYCSDCGKLMSDGSRQPKKQNSS